MNFFLVILTALVILNPLVVYSKKTISDAGGFLDTTVEQTGIEKRDVNQTVGVVIKMVLGIVGSAFFILMVYAGFVWLTARGNEERVEKARKTIIAAVIGLVITVGAYAATSLIVGRLSAPATTPSSVGGGTSGGGSVGDETGCCLYFLEGDSFGIAQSSEWSSEVTTHQNCRQISDSMNLATADWDFVSGANVAACTALKDKRNQP